MIAKANFVQFVKPLDPQLTNHLSQDVGFGLPPFQAIILQAFEFSYWQTDG